MIGASRESLATVADRLDARRSERGFADLPGQLLSVAALLDREKGLRVALADSGQPLEVRTGLVRQLLTGRVGDLALAVLGDVVAQRWSGGADLVDAVEQLGVQAAFTTAEADGTLDRVEDELFRFGRVAAGSPALQMALTDPALPAGARTGVLRDLLAGKVAPVTASVLEYAVGHLRGRRVDAVVEELSRLAAAQRDRVVAVVRVAVPLDAARRQRMAAALSALKGRQVRLDVVVDPGVVGGVHVRIGDEVIDGTVATRLAQARRALTETR